MKLSGNKIQIDYTPLIFSDFMTISGGTPVQFYDGNFYYPNRAGSPGSPIVIKHAIKFVDQDGVLSLFPYSTLFYENDVLITAQTAGYTILPNNELRVSKNVAAGTTLVIRAESEMLDTRTDKVYKVSNKTYLRTILKTEAPYQLELSPSGRQTFDGYRNPNTITTVTAAVKIDGKDIASYAGVTFKWLNADGLDCVDNELYADAYSNGNRTITIDKTYIDNETISCEAWLSGKLIAFDSVTFVRKFNSFRSEVRIPELPITAGVTQLNCSVHLHDVLGEIDVDASFLVAWMLQEGVSTAREIATGAKTQIPISSLNLKAVNVQIYPDLKRREAWAAITDDDDYILTDDDDNVLTVETYGA